MKISSLSKRVFLVICLSLIALSFTHASSVEESKTQDASAVKEEKTFLHPYKPYYQPTPVPVYKPAPVYTPTPVPVYKPKPIYKPTPVPIYKPKPIYKPTPVPIYIPKPTPISVPVYKHPFLKHPFFKHPFFNKPYPPSYP